MDFHAVAEAFVNGQWRVVDATCLAPRQTLVRIATGRDAADTAFLDNHNGAINLTNMTVSRRRTATCRKTRPSNWSRSSSRHHMDDALHMPGWDEFAASAPSIAEVFRRRHAATAILRSLFAETGFDLRCATSFEQHRGGGGADQAGGDRDVLDPQVLER